MPERSPAVISRLVRAEKGAPGVRGLGHRRRAARIRTLPTSVAILLTWVVSAGCATGPTPSPAQIIREVVLLDDRNAAPMDLSIIDEAGHLAEVRPANAAQLAEHLPSLSSDQIAVDWLPPDDRVLVLWAGLACDRAGTMTLSVDGGSITVAPEPISNCDLVPSYRGVELTFNLPRPAESLRVDLRPTEVTGDNRGASGVRPRAATAHFAGCRSFGVGRCGRDRVLVEEPDAIHVCLDGSLGKVASLKADLEHGEVGFDVGG